MRLLDSNSTALPLYLKVFKIVDGKTYTFHLRDAKWANGEPVTAEDFVYAWRRHCKMSQEYAYIFGNTVACVKNADAVIKGADPQTLGVELDAPVPFFPALMAFPTFYPINEKFCENLSEGTYGTSPETFLSNGAFVLSSYVPSTANIQLKKNDSYWNAANVNLRLAITNAIDRESLVNNFVMTGAKATYTAIPVDFAPNAETGKFFAEDQKRFADVVSFNVAKAQKYLELAKSELGKDTFELELIYSNDGGDTSAKVVQAIKSQVEENLPGVTIKLQPMPKAEYLSKVTSDNYDLALIDWVPDYDAPMTFFTLWTTEGGLIAEYDQIIADCTTGSLAADYSARWNALYDAEKILLDNAVIAPLYTDVNAVLIAPNVTGIEFHVAGTTRVFKNVKLK